MSATPETKYAHSGGTNIAYQVVGEGSLKLVYEGYAEGWHLYQVSRYRFVVKHGSF